MQMEMIAGIVLGIGTVEDLRQKKVSLRSPVFGGVLALVVRVGLGTVFSWECLGGVLTGLICLAIARVSGGQLGSGDGWVLMACGICLGLRRQLMLLLLAMVIFIGVGTVGICLKLWSGRTRLAFVPFLCGSFVIQVIWRGIICTP